MTFLANVKFLQVIMQSIKPKMLSAWNFKKSFVQIILYFKDITLSKFDQSNHMPHGIQHFFGKKIDEIPALFVLVILLEIEIGKRLRVKEGMCRQEKRQEEMVVLFIA